MSKMLTPEEARNRLSRIGKTATDLAREINVHPRVVAAVLGGQLRGDRGDAHKAAVALGLKDGVVIKDGVTIADAMRAAG